MAQNTVASNRNHGVQGRNNHRMNPSQEPAPPKVLGVLGERASMTKTLNYGALAREQMSGVAQMEKQMHDNLRRFDVKHGLSAYGYN